MAQNSIDLINLDFISLKNNFKNYLRNQPQFKDYDFEGSNINVLLDLLAYNTFKNSFFTNMLFAEGFLDTAQLRSSIVSHAKELNYTPRSMRSSKATIKVDFEATGENQPYVIPKGSSLTSLVKSSAYNFTIPETITVSSANNSFSFTTDIYEGVYVQDTYVYRQTSNTVPRFKITNKNVDTTSITVLVFDDGSSNGQSYTLSSTLLDLNFKSKVYFLQCSENEYYELYFGDDVLGKKPKEYSTIVIDYRVTEGPKADGALDFNLNFNPTGTDGELITASEITTVSQARGGAEAESIESIRYYAPKAFQVQERTVTEQDYEIALKTQFPEINAVHAFGGETLTPPRYGRVFVSVDIADVDGFPDSKKREYLNFIKRKAPFSIEPIFIEPEYVYLAADILVRYNLNLTKVSTDTIRTLVTNAVLDYRNEELNDFNVTLRDSKLACDLDDIDISIVSTNMDILVYKKYAPDLGTPNSFILHYDMEMRQDIPEKQDIHSTNDLHVFHSSDFRLNGDTCSLEDDGAGNIRVVKREGDVDSKIYNVGTINYDTGTVEIMNFTVDFYVGDAMKFYILPADKDITVKNNVILTIEEEEIKVEVEQLRL